GWAEGRRGGGGAGRRWGRGGPGGRGGAQGERREPGPGGAPRANAARQDRRVLLAHLAPPDQRARRVSPAQHPQFASSLVRIAFAVETTKSWLVLFARAVRPTERSARPPARQQPGYVYVGDLGHRVAANSRPPICGHL